MKKYIIGYNNYDELLSILGHDVPHTNVENVRTIIVDLIEEDYLRLLECGIDITPDGKVELCYLPSNIPVRGYPLPYNPFSDFMKITEAHLAGFDGTGVNVGVMDTGCNDSGVTVTPSVIRQDYTGSGVQDDINHGGKAINILGQVKSAFAPNPDIAYGGICKGSQLYSMKVYDGIVFSTVPIINAISWAISNNIHVINISIDYGGGLTSAINSAVAAGIIVVCASGNDRTFSMAHPANIPGVIAVNAVSYDNAGVPFGGYLIGGGNNEVTIVTYDGGSAETFLGGTSQAANHVSGLMAIYKQKYPSLDTPKAINLLRRKALKMDGFTYDIPSTTTDTLLDYETGAGFMAPIN